MYKIFPVQSKMKSHICLLLFTILCSSLAVSAQRPEVQVTNQEIRDAILSLVHSYSLLDNKLERHEQRERSLGEFLKRGLGTVQKNQKIFEPLKGTLTRLEERVSSIETVLLQNEEKAAVQQEKLALAMEAVLKWMGDNSQQFGGNKNSIGDEDESEGLAKNIEDLSDNVKGLRRAIAELKADKDSTEETNKSLLEQAEKLVNSKLASADEVILKLEEKLSQFYITSPAQTPTHNTEWEEKVTENLNEIKTNIDSIKSILPITPLPDKEFIHTLANETLEAIEDMRLEVLTASDKSFTKTAARIKETNEKLEASVTEIFKTLTEDTTALSTETQDNFKIIREEITNLTSLKPFILQSGEYSLEAKRAIDYGITQMRSDIAEVVKASTKTLNTTVTKRFDAIAATILDNHNGAMANLSSKIETEISQVWRQIGIMYQEISSSKQALDRLQQQTEAYVNGTLMTMDSMEGKVSLITGRMTEVDANLNYLLGRLSLVTQEFNKVKIGLGETLDNIRSSFVSVQEKVNKGPGPHQIPPEQEADYNNLAKREVPKN